MNEHLATVYDNIWALAKYRQYAIQSPKLEESELMPTLRAKKLVVVAAKTQAQNNVEIILIADPGIVNLMSKFRSHLASILNTDKDTRTILIAENSSTEDAQDQVSKNIDIALRKNNINYEYIPMYLLNCVLPEQDMIDEHAIVTDLEEMKFCSTMQLARISVRDSMAIWIGASIGDIVRIIRKTENNLTEYYYRRVVA